MKPYAITSIAGLVCLPATYNFTKEGNIVMSLVIVGLFGCISGVLAATQANRPKTLSLLLSFVAGALISQVIFFAHYYYNYGHKDPKLVVGEAVAIIQFGVISVVGGLALQIGRAHV